MEGAFATQRLVQTNLPVVGEGLAPPVTSTTARKNEPVYFTKRILAHRPFMHFSCVDKKSTKRNHRGVPLGLPLSPPPLKYKPLRQAFTVCNACAGGFDTEKGLLWYVGCGWSGHGCFAARFYVRNGMDGSGQTSITVVGTTIGRPRQPQRYARRKPAVFRTVEDACPYKYIVSIYSHGTHKRNLLYRR